MTELQVGQIVGNLTVLQVERRRRGHVVHCRCRCGKEFVKNLAELLRGKRKSCGNPKCGRQPGYGSGRFTRDGYECVRVGGKERFVHRLVMERHLGRTLAAQEEVHHVNGDKLDNRLENLVVLDRKKHSRMHAARLSDICRLLKENETLRAENHRLTSMLISN